MPSSRKRHPSIKHWSLARHSNLRISVRLSDGAASCYGDASACETVLRVGPLSIGLHRPSSSLATSSAASMKALVPSKLFVATGLEM